MSIAENGNRLGRLPSLGKSETSVMNSVARNPSFARDIDVVIEGVNQAISVYKKTLFRAGIRPNEIMDRVDQIKDGITCRSRAIRFIQTVKELSSNNDSRNGSNNGNLNETGIH